MNTPMDCVTYMELAGIIFIPSYDEEANRTILHEPLFTITGSFEGLSIYRMRGINQGSDNKLIHQTPKGA